MNLSKLQFERFRVWQVVVPASRETIFPHAAPAADHIPWDHSHITLVEGVTTDGIIACGESDRGDSKEAVEQTLRHLLTLDLRQAHPVGSWGGAWPPSPLPDSYEPVAWSSPQPFLQSLYETLWLDAVGKSSGLPAHALLGGKVRDLVKVDVWANRPDENLLRTLVVRALENGYRGIKLKCDAFGDTVAAIWNIHRDLPDDFHFTIDPMCAWKTYRECRPLLETLEKIPQSIYLEDPYPHQAIGEWERTRDSYRIPLIWHARDQEILRLGLTHNVSDAYNLVGRPAFEFLSSSAMLIAGLSHCWHGSSLELGVQQHARLHACAASRACTMPSDLSSQWVREHTLVEPVMRVEKGSAVVPALPGLGVSLDHSAIPRYSINHWEIK